MRSTWNFYSAGQLVFGPGAASQIGTRLRRLNVKRVLIVTDKALCRAGVVDTVRQSLAEAQLVVETFDEGEAEPSIATASMAIDAARALSPEAIIGIGGGSNIDLAKFTAIVASHGGEVSGYFGWDKVPAPVIPLVAVATTAGTGSEVSHAAVLTDKANQIKVSTQSQYLRPTIAIVDPLLMLSCPRRATADAGIDALVHAIEAYSAIDYTQLDVPAGETWPYDGRHPLGDCLAEKAIRLVGEHLVTAVNEPDNLAAREGMALAATLAGMAFSNCGVALVHALEYPLGGTLHCSHGAGNGLLLPYVMRYNLPERRETFARIASLLGVNTSGMSTDEAAESAIAAVEQLRRDIDIPLRIRDLGGTPQQLEVFAKKSFEIKRLMLLNPRQPTEADLLEILRSAL